MNSPALRLQGISKRFGALLANADITLELAAGEVLGLLGENGAGKSTLMAILFGHYVADAGTIEAFGVPLPPGRPKAALAAGIGMVHQHFTLADNLSVLDNVLLGAEPLWAWRSRRSQARAQLLEAAQRFGLQVDPGARVADLSVGERQRVEILKALVPIGRRQGARLLILDEPTAVLTPQESEALFATLSRMVGAGLSIIFISHKLDEVLCVAQRIAVLRAGRLVALLPRAAADRASLAQAMVGHAVRAPVKRSARAAEVVLQLDRIGVASHGRAPLLDGVSFTLRAGEVLAIAGVAGNGLQTLAGLLGGGRSAGSGVLRVNGQTLPARPRAWLRQRVARVPEDRLAVGVVGDLALWENLLLERYDQAPFSRLGWLRRGVGMAFARSIVERFDVRGAESAGVNVRTASLSGGNVQKLILARVLAFGGPRLIVANQPTWGLDVGAVAAVHQQLLDARAAGSALLLISEDLDEIFALADRIAVMHRGRLGPAREPSAWTLAAIGLAMAGEAESVAA